MKTEHLRRTALKRWTSNYHDAEDAAQEAQLKALLHQPESNAWYYTTVRNELITRHRLFRNQTATWPSDTLDLIPTTSPPESQMLKEENHQSVHSALLQLRPDDRLVLLMRYWVRLSTQQIAFVFECNDHSVYMRLRRAKQRFAELWSN